MPQIDTDDNKKSLELIRLDRQLKLRGLFVLENDLRDCTQSHGTGDTTH